jgi:hypothetical protein
MPGFSPVWLHPIIDLKPWPEQFRSLEMCKNGDDLCPLEGGGCFEFASKRPYL